ncbi:hypothetical protein ACQ5ES_05590 [Pseudidiomarina sp. E22-M8]|uniref:hypothetical protein n=1 Tax=Pseudidiomarina sp. E22-M8 TaxID=3424768 RepID=UPI00403C5C98
MTNSQKQLLIVAAFLAALQFVVKPVLNWQDELTTELALTQGQVERSEQLLKHAEQVTAAHEAILRQREEVLNALPEVMETTLLQIQMQGTLETLFGKHKVGIVEFNWVTGLQAKSETLATLNAKISLIGTIDNLAQAQLALMQEFPFVRHESIELREAPRQRGNYHELSLLIQVAVRQPETSS